MFSTPRGVDLPPMLYGTAWKEERTESCVRHAIKAGFRGIDTANQRRHYYEAGVGAAIADTPRDQLFLQTKFTFRRGQDHRLPYDPAAAVATQVQQSFDSSLEHLGVKRLDSYVLHGPSQHPGLGPPDHQAWAAIQSLRDQGRVRLLGVSNVDADQLRAFCDLGRPDIVQNRCYARLGWDAKVREICEEHGIVYQGFSLLTANRAVWNSSVVADIARARGWTPAQVILRFALDTGIQVLTGTTDPAHMRQDLAILDQPLDRADRQRIAALRG